MAGMKAALCRDGKVVAEVITDGNPQYRVPYMEPLQPKWFEEHLLDPNALVTCWEEVFHRVSTVPCPCCGMHVYASTNWMTAPAWAREAWKYGVKYHSFRPPEKRYAVYPGAENIDLGPKRCVAVCASFSQADYLRTLWGNYSYIEEYYVTNPPKEVKEFLSGD